MGKEERRRRRDTSGSSGEARARKSIRKDKKEKDERHGSRDRKREDHRGDGGRVSEVTDSRKAGGDDSSRRDRKRDAQDDGREKDGRHADTAKGGSDREARTGRGDKRTRRATSGSSEEARAKKSQRKEKKTSRDADKDNRRGSMDRKREDRHGDGGKGSEVIGSGKAGGDNSSKRDRENDGREKKDAETPRGEGGREARPNREEKERRRRRATSGSSEQARAEKGQRKDKKTSRDAENVDRRGSRDRKREDRHGHGGRDSEATRIGKGARDDSSKGDALDRRDPDRRRDREENDKDGRRTPRQKGNDDRDRATNERSNERRGPARGLERSRKASEEGRRASASRKDPAGEERHADRGSSAGSRERAPEEKAAGRINAPAGPRPPSTEGAPPAPMGPPTLRPRDAKPAMLAPPPPPPRGMPLPAVETFPGAKPAGKPQPKVKVPAFAVASQFPRAEGVFKELLDRSVHEALSDGEHLLFEKMKLQYKWFEPPSDLGMGPDGVKLEVSKQDAKLDGISLDGSPFYLFGKDAGLVEVACEHPSVSRVHCAIHFTTAGRMYLTDLGSTYGTTHKRAAKAEASDDAPAAAEPAWVKLAPKAPVELVDGDAFRVAASTRVYTARFKRLSERKLRKQREALETKRVRDLAFANAGDKRDADQVRRDAEDRKTRKREARIEILGQREEARAQKERDAFAAKAKRDLETAESSPAAPSAPAPNQADPPDRPEADHCQDSSAPRAPPKAAGGNAAPAEPTPGTTQGHEPRGGAAGGGLVNSLMTESGLDDARMAQAAKSRAAAHDAEKPGGAKESEKKPSGEADDEEPARLEVLEEQQATKRLIKLLTQPPPSLDVDGDGWVALARLLEGDAFPEFAELTVAHFKAFVLYDSKKRFVLRTAPGTREPYIRAADTGLFEDYRLALSPTEPAVPVLLAHATTLKAWRLIERAGCLSRMTRKYMHFAAAEPLHQLLQADPQPDLAAVQAAISGLTQAPEVVLFVASDVLAGAGASLFSAGPGGESQHYVTEGKKGQLKLKLFSEVRNLKTGAVLHKKK
ncbi:hypothetical protein DIPPA_17153 [Diplonema papillatum]|nr:hypothetical protein DIPPA_17153 [Diplonema papillatum]